MSLLALLPFHERRGARFTEINGAAVVEHYGDPLAEHAALRQTAGVLDLGCRSRLCLVGSDRVRFLNGQVSNDVKALRPGNGCYAGLLSAKGKLESDLNIYCLPDELLLDFEPGFGAAVTARLESYIVADDVQVVDVAPLYGLLSVQGPAAAAAVERAELGLAPPDNPLAFSSRTDPALGELYLVRQPRTGAAGFDLFAPTAALESLMLKLLAAVESLAGRACGWSALEIARVEAGLPRFGMDMDESNLLLETGIETRALSSVKGCYIGQEVVSRLLTQGRVTRALRGLRLADGLSGLPTRGDKLFQGQQEVGYTTSAVFSPSLRANLAFGYVRREANHFGAELRLRTVAGESTAHVVPVPFVAGPSPAEDAAGAAG